MIVSDNKTAAEGLGRFLKFLGGTSAKTVKKLAKKMMKNPGRALQKNSECSSR